MMTFNTGKSVMAAINEIAATSSKKEKEALIKQAGATSTLFMKALTYAYNPFNNYGISNAPHKTPGCAPGGNTLEEPLVWKTLDDLLSRTLSGNSARDTVQNMVNLLDEPSAEMFRRIVNKDMRAGFTDGTVNRVFPKTFAEFPYMRCSLPDKSNMPKWTAKDWEAGIFSQEKADGMFANVNHDHSGSVWITSRQGSLFPAESLGALHLDVAAALAAGTQTHGELIVYEAGKLLPREQGNGVMNSLASGGALEADQQVVFLAWDQIPLESVVPGGKYAESYKARFLKLARQCIGAQRAGIASVRAIPTRIVKSKAEAYAHYRELLKQKKEGTVVKHPDAIWQDTTSKNQVKLKLQADVELRVKGRVPGKPGTKTEATFGSLLCESECGRLQVAVSGFTDAKRQEIHENFDKFMDSIMTVRSNSIMEPDGEGDDLYSLFLPRTVEFRLDKTMADTLEMIQEQFRNAVEAA